MGNVLSHRCSVADQSVRQASLRGAAKLVVVIATLLVCIAAHAQDAAPAGSIVISPATIELRHPRQPQSLQVLATTADGFSLDLRGGARFTSADTNTARVDERGWVQPVASGQTQIMIEAAGQTLTVPV
ncbi:MAG TPA: hypothetical protein VGH74_09920, partial [Planctomycetaceae bacterium]